MGRKSSLLILSTLLASIFLSTLTSTIAFTRVGALTLNSGENQLPSGVIDVAGGFAYFGTSTSPGVVVKVRLSDFTRVGALTLNSGEGFLDTGVIDVAGGFAYFGTFTSPGVVVKVRLSDFTRVGALTLNSGENDLLSGVIDAAGGYAYFGTNTSPGLVVKVRLSDFTRVGALTLNSGENSLYSGVIDVAGGFAYFGTGTSPGIVVKVRLSDFTRVGALTLNTGETSLFSGVIDVAGGFAYFGTGTSPGLVVKVRLSDFTRVGALTLNSGENGLGSAVIDAAGGYAYFGTSTSPGVVVKAQVASPPSAPSGLSAAGGARRVSLAWSAPTSNGDRAILGYKVYRGTTSGSESLFTTIGNQTTYNDTSVTSGTTYYYKLTAYSNFAESPLSGEATATTALVPSAPLNPQAIGGTGKISLTWTAPSSNGGSPITGYNIYRATTPGSEALLNSIGNLTSYTDSPLNPSTTYYYKITAASAAGESSPSSEATATTRSAALALTPIAEVLTLAGISTLVLLQRRRKNSSTR